MQYERIFSKPATHINVSLCADRYSKQDAYRATNKSSRNFSSLTLAVWHHIYIQTLKQSNYLLPQVWPFNRHEPFAANWLQTSCAHAHNVIWHVSCTHAAIIWLIHAAENSDLAYTPKQSSIIIWPKDSEELMHVRQSKPCV
jgi:hypothetical protein